MRIFSPLGPLLSKIKTCDKGNIKSGIYNFLQKTFEIMNMDIKPIAISKITMDIN